MHALIGKVTGFPQTKEISSVPVADPSCCSTTVLEEKADPPGLAHIGEAQLGLNALPRRHGKEGADTGSVLLSLQAQPSPA